MSETKKVAIVITSTRTPRIGPKVADIVKGAIAQDAATSNIELSIVDVADYKLPVFDEAIMPAAVPHSGKFVHEHSLAWSAEMIKHDAYIFVIPEYNYGVTGGTKNAIDYLYHEWIGKPVAIVSYGIHGGKFASEQVRQTLDMMKLKVAETRPQLAFANGNAGPDLFMSAGKGEVGEESRKKWEAESATVLKAFEEIKTLLNEPPKA